MANIKSAKKRARQAIKRRANNVGRRSMMRTAIKSLLKSIQSGDKEMAPQHFREAESIIDRVSKNNAIHKNKASRLKSRLNKHLKRLMTA